jgi:hypothetical protein
MTAIDQLTAVKAFRMGFLLSAPQRQYRLVLQG